jgi:hypothetical protein
MDKALVPFAGALDLAQRRGVISPAAVRTIKGNRAAVAHATRDLGFRVSGIASGTAVLIKYVGVDDSWSLIELAEATGVNIVGAICEGVSGNIAAARALGITNTFVTLETMKGPRPKIACMKLNHPKFPKPAMTKLHCDGGTPLYDFGLSGLAYIVALMEQLQAEADAAADLAGTPRKRLEFIIDASWFGDGEDTTSFATAKDVAAVMVPMVEAGHTFSGYGVGNKFAPAYAAMGIPAKNIHRVEPGGIARTMIAGGDRTAKLAITGRR